MEAVYIHIPFCKSICSYCDFSKMFYNKEFANNYLAALEKEINTNYQNEKIKTLYIGGGTPNSLSDVELERLFKILKIINLQDNYEYTIECNIELLTENQINLFNKYGINRVSIGIQTFNEKYLKFLNRNHTKEEVFNKIKLLKKKGIDNINIDLIYGIPGQTKEELLEDINLFKSLDIPHISTYSLIIEPHTVLYNKHIKNIDEDLDREMYDLIIKNLDNYKHYETSNFAKTGFESKHNLTYWNNANYYGFGLGASGYINNIRYDNTRNIDAYIKGDYLKEQEELDFNTTVENEFILGFRKIDGISIDTFYNKYHINMLDIDIVKKLLEEGKLVNIDNKVRISDDYLYIANEILIDFLGVNYEKYSI